MDYAFICPNCGNKEEISMRITEYKADGHMCSKCGTELVRDVKSYCGNFKANFDGFFGKSTDHK